jgi:hypothetical protein
MEIPRKNMKLKKKTAFFSWLVLVFPIGAIFIYAFSFKPVIQPQEVLDRPVMDSPQVDLTYPKVTLGDSIEQFGKEFLGVPYVYGGTSKEGFDCSGFVYYVFDNFQIKVPRTTAQFADFGKEVAIDSVKKGDLLLFLSPTRNAIGHIGIVTEPKGMESDFIHASSYSKEMKVMISSLKQPNYTRRFVKAVTVLEN